MNVDGARDQRPFYFRFRGSVMGPFSLSQMRQKVATAQVSGRSEVSRDAVSWGRGSDFAEIFEQDQSIVVGGAPAGPRWFYAVEGQTLGPVEIDVLRGHVVSRVIGAGDYVAREDDNRWRAVAEVPELVMALPRPDGGQHPSGGVTAPVNVTFVQPEPTPTNGLAIAGFVCSLLGFVTVITWPIGFFLSMAALNGPNRANRGLAIAGAIIGGLFTAFLILWIAAIIVIVSNNR